MHYPYSPFSLYPYHIPFYPVYFPVHSYSHNSSPRLNSTQRAAKHRSKPPVAANENISERSSGLPSERLTVSSETPQEQADTSSAQHLSSLNFTKKYQPRQKYQSIKIRYTLKELVGLLCANITTIPYASIPLSWQPSSENVRRYLDEPQRCVRVGGVPANMETQLLCSMLQHVFNIGLLGAFKLGRGLFVVVLRDDVPDFLPIFALSEQFWLGPNDMFCPKTEEEHLLLTNLVAERIDEENVPHHTMTFTPWNPESKV